MSTKVKHIAGHVYELDPKKNKRGVRSFILPSGDGYTMEDFAVEIKTIQDYVGGGCSPNIYSGLDYEHIPFDEIYAIWNDNGGRGNGKYYKKPAKEEFNSYEHGFIHVLV